MHVISPAALANIDTGEYRVAGAVLRVFDTNAAGELLMVSFFPGEDPSRFTLKHPPAGTVYAEHVSG